MNINFNYSSMFSGMGRNQSLFGASGLYGLVGEYNNIRSGAYYKALKGYYNSKTEDASSVSGSDKNSDKNSVSDRLDSLKNDAAAKAYTNVKEEAKDLKDAASVLTETGSKSLFIEKEKTVKDEETGEETTVREIDKQAITSAVKEFASAYNDTLKAVDESGNTDIIRNAGYMTRQSEIFGRALEEVGITVNKDNTLSVDEEKLASAKTENLQTLFNGKNSYASFVSQRADMVNTAATNAATSANNFYSKTGNYQNFGMAFNAMDWYL